MTRPLIPARPQLWVGRTQAALASPLGVPQRRDFDAAAGLRRACAELAGTATRWRGIEVVVSDAHCRYLVLPRAAGIQGRAELDASIAARFASAFGDDPADWLLQRDGALLGDSDLVCALRRDTADAIRAGLADARRRLHRLQPLWVWCSRQPVGDARKPHWLASSDGDTLTMGLFHQQHCVAVRSTRRDAGGLGAALSREAARQADHATGTPVWLFGAEAPPPWLDDGSPVVASGRTMPFAAEGVV
ncbi:hypothetical protein GCM10025771_09230 [Niveibacterium umoris]|uniref:Uncharacterized protein n=1 Tax=Niveibacterium umoris TaxID=1193620 RepID=A0A840BPS2_9RHOO|nr:hypothetical protein [Niveibacterium umoris]MBB4013528.1 hypothetical protein [Niveibacterium umoris]